MTNPEVQRGGSMDESRNFSADVGVRPKLTVVVPTFNEAENVAELTGCLAAAIPDDLPFEIIFVDDSNDETPAIISELVSTSLISIAIVHRNTPVGGLGGAVVEGLRMARAEWAVVMDADLQHPPDSVPALLRAGRESEADLVVASRYAEDGGSGGLANGYREFVSRGSTVLARAMFPRTLRLVSDPMSGFFAIRLAAFDLDRLRPQGFKILLELIVRIRPKNTVEVPYRFRERFRGKSKCSLREGVRFLRQLAALRLGDSGAVRTLAFGCVGLTGIIPNLSLLWILTSAGIHYAVATVFATQVAIVWNFLLLDVLVFSGNGRWGCRGRFGSFMLVNNVDLLVRLPLLTLLVERGGMGLLTATLITIFVSFLFRFLITDRIIYRRRSRSRPIGLRTDRVEGVVDYM